MSSPKVYIVVGISHSGKSSIVKNTTRRTDMKPQWIDRLYIGPFWMGTPEEIARTQEAIDEATNLTDENEEDLIDSSINTETETL